jgi:hypothetical protein
MKKMNNIISLIYLTKIAITIGTNMTIYQVITIEI